MSSTTAITFSATTGFSPRFSFSATVNGSSVEPYELDQLAHALALS
jgi:hypothetical protein